MLFLEDSDHCTWELRPNFTFKPRNKSNDKVQNKASNVRKITRAPKYKKVILVILLQNRFLNEFNNMITLEGIK